MTEHTRTCKECGKPFTTTHPRRLYCLACRPPGTRYSRTHRLTRQERLWCEIRSFENLINFYREELKHIQTHHTQPKDISKNFMGSMKRYGVIKGRGPYRLTPEAEKIMEVSR